MSRPIAVAIVGAGFGGLCLAMKLKAAGVHDIVVIDKNPQIGGTWAENVYPGAACDIDSHRYSYSFLPNPPWTRKFAGQAEILAYLHDCVRAQRLEPHLRLGAEVTEAVFDETEGLWRLSVSEGAPILARVLAPACGQLNRPAYPAIPGLDAFVGPCFHSARWDRAFDPRGKAVAVIGTGASAVQIVPEIAGVAARVTLFQRSGAWVLPKGDRPFSRMERLGFSHVPGLARLYRAAIAARNEARGLAFTRFPWMLAAMAWLARRRIAATVRSPEKRAALRPRHRIGCKRVLVSDDWLPAIDRDDVDLVTSAITAIEADRVTTADGRAHRVDAIILATGFSAANPLAALNIAGAGGLALNEVWREGAFAYKGMSVPGFPNLFILYGPNTNLSHDSIVPMLEAQADYVVEAVALMRARGLRTLAVTPEATAQFDAFLQTRLKRTAWSASCASWYKSASGRITTNWPGLVSGFRAITRRFEPADHDLT